MLRLKFEHKREILFGQIEKVELAIGLAAFQG